MISRYHPEDFQILYSIINDAAQAYRGIIPADRWHDPYMSANELEDEIKDGVRFWCYSDGEEMQGVMGIQDKGPVSLIRHAYVRTRCRRNGIGGELLKHVYAQTTAPVLVGTWKAAFWAIDFYSRHGFKLVTEEQKNTLLDRFWSIPARQIETSVVLADRRWFKMGKAGD